MQWNLKAGAALITLSLAVSGCGLAGGRKDGPGFSKALPEAPMDQTADRQGGNLPSAPEAYDPVEAIQYDEVGYAVMMADAPEGGTASGEAFNPRSYGAAHASLPMPSYVELTRLDTGKTILVRINDRAAAGSGAMVSLTPSAAQALGLDQGSRIPVRVRKVSPSEQERSALRAGQKPGDRLETPEALLIALRKKLGSGPMVAAAPKPAVAQPRLMARPLPSVAAAKPAAGQVGPSARAGADYSGAAPVDVRPPAAPLPSAQVMRVPVEMASTDDRFIVEDASSPRAGRPAAPASRPGLYYVQVAAFAQPARASSLARQVGGSVERAGNIFRVRTGPYAEEDEARAALGAAAAKGYRDARITR
jgi:rare lipoprotein A